MKNITIINIDWEIVEFDVNFKKIKEKIADSDYGVYQIYGHHHAYGKNSLLYIGKAVEQKFGTRLNERFEFIESCTIPTNIRLGRIVTSNKNENKLDWDKNRWKEMIHISEKILIKTHLPAMNKQDNTGVFSAELNEFKGENFLIINWGDYGDLLPETSTIRASFRYWDFETPLI